MGTFTQAMADKLAGDLSADSPSILAVADVESGGRSDLPDGRPQILFEAQWFHKLTGGAFDSSHPGISSPIWDRSLYKGGAAEFDRLAEASALNSSAALMSASWGLFQIMGFNYRPAGFHDVESFVDSIKGGDDNDMAAFANFIKANPAMLAALRGHDDRTFAMLYNGTGQVDVYANLIGAARARHGGSPGMARTLRQGESGDDVRLLQKALGITPVDGAFGPQTDAAVKAAQTHLGVKPVDGLVGPMTRKALGL